MQTLETFLLKCPTETTPFVTQIIDTANKLTKFDPNYAAGSDDVMDEDAANGINGDDSDDNDEEYADEYDDEDDVSWKIRRASAKVLSIAIQTRLELLSYFYKAIAPVLLSRFAEREEIVKIEIWSTYTALLKQTAVWVGSANYGSPTSGTSANSSENGSVESRATSPVSTLKRKRDVNMDPDDS